MAAPSEARLRLGSPDDLRDATTRSHLSDGRCLALYAAGSAHCAVDAELDVEPPALLVSRHGRAEFWERWTRAECTAKLLAVPIAVWLRRHGLDPVDHPGLRVTTWRPAGLDPALVVSVGTLSAD